MRRVFLLASYSLLIFVLPRASLALPPQLEAANDFIYSTELKRLPQYISGCFDQKCILHLVYSYSNTDYSKPYRYTSISPSGLMQPEPITIFPCGIYACHEDAKILSDSDGNIHIVATNLEDMPSYDHVMLNETSTLTMNAKIDPPPYFSFSSVHFLPNKAVIINGVGKFEALGPDYEMFFQRPANSPQFKLTAVLSPVPKDRRENWHADLWPLDDTLVLVMAPALEHGQSEFKVRKAIFDLRGEKVVDFQYFDPRDSLAYVYTKLRRDLNLGYPAFVDLGDTLIYWLRIPNWSEKHEPAFADTLGMLLLDKKGRIISSKAPEYIEASYEDLDSVRKGDVLCRVNGFPSYWHDIESSYSPFGLISFRRFPRIIIDTGGR